MTHRRTFLRATGATIVSATVAGCSGKLTGGDDADPPEYARWLPADDSGELTFAYLDRSVDGAFSNARELVIDRGLINEIDDLMLGFPVSGLLLVRLRRAGLYHTGLAGLALPAGWWSDRTAGDYETSIDEILVVNNAVVLLGDVDTDEIDYELRNPPEPENDPTLVRAFERTDAIDGYDLYEPTEVDGSVFAVSEDAICASVDIQGASIESIRPPIEARAGDRDRAVDEIEDVEWLLETAGRGDLVFGSTGSFETTEQGEHLRDETPGLDDATGAVASLTIDGESETSGDLASTFEDEVGDERRSKLERVLGADADEVDVTVADDRVVAAATWETHVYELLRAVDDQ